MKAPSSRRSFAKVVQATINSFADSCGLKKPILGLLDLFPVAACFEWENGGENLRLAVDCSEMEKNMEKRANGGSDESSGSVKKAKKMKGTLVNHSQNKILGCGESCAIGLRPKWVGWLVMGWIIYPQWVFKGFVWAGSHLSPNWFV